MSIWEKCKALQIGKMRMFRIFLLIEGLLLVWGIFNLFGRDAVYEYGPEDMTVNFGNYDAETGCFIDEGVGQQGNAVDFCEIALPKGIYSVSLHYETDTHMHNLCEVTDDTVGFKMMKTNMEHLYASLHQTDFNMWVLQGSQHLTAHAYYDGVGTLLVTGLTIRETNALYRIYLFWIVVFSLLWNGAYLYIQYDKKYQIPAIDKNVLFGLGVILAFSSFLLMVDYSIPGGDLLYHLLRIEGIKDNLLAGQFPSRISPEWQQGYGYASPIFYGETLLYIGALFRLIGFTVTTSYRLFFFVINILAIGISYYSFSRLFKDKYIGLLCTALYVLSVYRIYKMFVCGSFGEVFGMMFLPLLAYGFYQVFTGDIRDANYKKSLIPLVIGFSGLLQSHFLTGEMAGGVTVFLCLFFWKKVFRKETFFVLAKTVIYSVLLSAWFLVPFADYMMTGDFVIHHVSARTIQHRGLYLAHLFLTFPIGGGNPLLPEKGMFDSQPAALGAVLLFVLVLWLGLWFFRKLQGLSGEEIGLGKTACITALLAMLMSLKAFPWDRIQAFNGVTATLVSSLQFPNRFLMIANIALTILAGVVAKWVFVTKGQRAFGGICIVMAVLLLISSQYVSEDILSRDNYFCVQNAEGMGTGYISGAEYLPYGAEPSQFWPHAPSGGANLIVEHYKKEAHVMEIACKNNGAKEEAMVLPILYYKGYQAYDLSTGERLPVYAGTNFSVTVTVPAGYEGIVRTVFESPWYWRAAEMVSLVSLILMCAAAIHGRGIRQDWHIKEVAVHENQGME